MNIYSQYFFHPGSFSQNHSHVQMFSYISFVVKHPVPVFQIDGDLRRRCYMAINNALGKGC